MAVKKEGFIQWARRVAGLSTPGEREVKVPDHPITHSGANTDAVRLRIRQSMGGIQPESDGGELAPPGLDSAIGLVTRAAARRALTNLEIEEISREAEWRANKRDRRAKIEAATVMIPEILASRQKIGSVVADVQARPVVIENSRLRRRTAMSKTALELRDFGMEEGGGRGKDFSDGYKHGILFLNHLALSGFDPRQIEWAKTELSRMEILGKPVDLGALQKHMWEVVSPSIDPDEAENMREMYGYARYELQQQMGVKPSAEPRRPVINVDISQMGSFVRAVMDTTPRTPNVMEAQELGGNYQSAAEEAHKRLQQKNKRKK